jgi:hypothetical protein
MRGFLRKALDVGFLTLEHAPPKSLGGKSLVLTCRECNTTAGGVVDSQMLALEQIYDFGQGTMTRPARARLETGSGKLNAEILAQGQVVQAVVIPQANDPRSVASVTAGLAGMAKDKQLHETEFRFTFKGPKPKAALVGWLRAAYLAAFAALGYSYILRPQLEVVREQLADDSAELLRVFSMTVPTAPRGERRILVVEEPEWLRSLCVQMGRHSVFLPGLSANPGLYTRLAQRAGCRAELTLAGKEIPWPARAQFTMDIGK